MKSIPRVSATKRNVATKETCILMSPIWIHFNRSSMNFGAAFVLENNEDGHAAGFNTMGFNTLFYVNYGRVSHSANFTRI